MASNDKFPEVIVVTPSIGNRTLYDAVTSVKNQNYQDYCHIIFVDGETYKNEVESVLNDFQSDKMKIVTLPFNTGSNGFNGHRIYASCAHLLNSKYVFFLDEDNWYDKNHIKSIIDLIEGENLDWAHSLRKICSYDTNFVAYDDCQSLGRWPPILRPRKFPHFNYPNLVDTSCYGFKTEVLQKVAHFWNHPLGADRIFFKHISSVFPYFTSTSEYTLNYRLKEHDISAASYFNMFNSRALIKYNGILPWKGQ